MEEVKPEKQEVIRDENGRWPKGVSGNMNGRPPGPTLKEFARQMLMKMSDDEKLEYLATLPKEIVWKMSEGNPHTTTDVTTDGQALTVNIIKFQNGDNNSAQLPATGLSAGLPTEQSEV